MVALQIFDSALWMSYHVHERLTSPLRKMTLLIEIQDHDFSLGKRATSVNQDRIICGLFEQITSNNQQITTGLFAIVCGLFVGYLILFADYLSDYL